MATISGKMTRMAETSARLLALLSLLQTRRVWAGPQLTERLQVSSRTMRRDIENLREMGYRIDAIKGPAGGYQLGAGSELPPLLFDDEQAVAIAVTLQSAITPGIEEAAARALATVRQVMPVRLRGRIATLQVTPVPRTPIGRTAPLDTDILLAVSAAVSAGEVLRFDYRTDQNRDGDAIPPRRAEPHHVVSHDGRWYLVAWDLDRDAWRTFRIDRMKLRIPNGPRFGRREIPGGDVGAFVAARFKGSHGANSWPCRGEVLLDLPATTAAPFVEDGTVEDLGPDRCRLQIGSWSWTALAAGIGRFDADFEVVGPPELAEACARLARRYADVAEDPTE